MLATDVTRALKQLSVELQGVCVCVCVNFVPSLFRVFAFLFPFVLTHCTCVVELDLGCEVQRLPSPLSPLQFYRDFVSKNKPCLLTGVGTQQLLAHTQNLLVAEAECQVSSTFQCVQGP